MTKHADHTAKAELLRKYAVEVLRLLALMGAQAGAKKVPLTLGDYMVFLESIIDPVVAMHCVDEPEIFPKALRKLAEAIIGIGREPLPEETREMRDKWAADGNALYQRAVSQNQMHRLSRSFLQAGEEPEPTKH